MNEEVLDIVSEQDQVIYQMARSEVYAKGIHSFRVINAFLMNSKGQLWIPCRHPNKTLFPLCLDVSVGGHVSAGENYEQALLREAKEEINFAPGTYQFEALAKLMPYKHNVSAFMYLYLIRSDREPNYNKNDFIESWWLYPDELNALLKKGEPAKGDMPILLDFFIKIINVPV